LKGSTGLISAAGILTMTVMSATVMAVKGIGIKYGERDRR
jgi:hypothetical protein